MRASVPACAHQRCILCHLRINVARSPLFMRAISCVRFRVYVPEQAYLHDGFMAIQIIYSPPGLQLCPGSWANAAFPSLPPTLNRSLALYHAWRHAAGLLQTDAGTLDGCSLQRRGGRGRAAAGRGGRLCGDGWVGPHSNGISR